jgi:hypothetical protein
MAIAINYTQGVRDPPDLSQDHGRLIPDRQSSRHLLAGSNEQQSPGFQTNVDEILSNHAAEEDAAAVSDDERMEPPAPPKATKSQMKQLNIKDTDRVIDFLYDRLDKIQQLSDKKIAKAWIKGICPKKQARYPYQNKQRLNDTGLKPKIPEWWPTGENEVIFREPDHIQKSGKPRDPM